MQTLQPHVTATLTSERASALLYAADEPAHCTRTVSAAATQGLTLTQSRCLPTSACLSQTAFAVVHFAFWYRSEKTGPSQSPCRADAISALSHQSFSFLALSLTVVLLWKNSRGALAQKEKNSCAQL